MKYFRKFKISVNSNQKIFTFNKGALRKKKDDDTAVERKGARNKNNRRREQQK